MARGELMKKLITSYGRVRTFRNVVLQIISAEERKGNRVLANSLKKSLDGLGDVAPRPAQGSKLLPFPDEARDFIQQVEPRRTRGDLLLSQENTELFASIIDEFRQADRFRHHGLDLAEAALLWASRHREDDLCGDLRGRVGSCPSSTFASTAWCLLISARPRPTSARHSSSRAGSPACSSSTSSTRWPARASKRLKPASCAGW